MRRVCYKSSSTTSRYVCKLINIENFCLSVFLYSPTTPSKTLASILQRLYIVTKDKVRGKRERQRYSCSIARSVVPTGISYTAQLRKK